MIHLRTAIDGPWRLGQWEESLEALGRSAVPYEAGRVARWGESRIEEVEGMDFALLVESPAGVFWLASNERVTWTKVGFPAFAFRELRDFFLGLGERLKQSLSKEVREPRNRMNEPRTRRRRVN